MKHKFIITYETDGLPICPDAIHEQLDLAMVNIRKNFAAEYAKLPGLHKLTLEPCGDWFHEEQKPMSFERHNLELKLKNKKKIKPQAASYKQQAASSNGGGGRARSKLQA